MSLITAESNRMTASLDETRFRVRSVTERRGDSISLGGLVAGSPWASMPYGGRADATPWHQQEQFGFFSGTLYTIIRLLANRMSRQHIQLARKVRSGTKPRRSRMLESKSFLPGSMKRLYNNIEVVDEHPIYTALERPNECMTLYTMLFTTFAGIEITGACYWWMDVDENGRVQIWPVPAHWCEPIHTKKRLFAGWLIGPPGVGNKARVPAEQVVPFRNPDPADPFAVLSPTQAMSRSVSVDAAMELAANAGFRNGANPGLAIMVGNPPEFAGLTGMKDAPFVLSGPQRDELTTWVKARYQGFLKNDEPLILDGLIKDVKKITLNPKELDYTNSSGTVSQKLYEAFSVNPISAGRIQDANRAQAVVADESLINNALAPRTEMVSQALTRWMPPFFGESDDLLIFSVTEALVDPEFQLEEDTALFDRGIKTRNELRAKRNLKRIVGGDNAYVQGIGDWIEVPLENEDGRDADNPRLPRPGMFTKRGDGQYYLTEKPRALWLHCKNTATENARFANERRDIVKTAIQEVMTELLRDVDTKAQRLLRAPAKKMTAEELTRALWDVDNAAALLRERLEPTLRTSAELAARKELERAKSAAKRKNVQAARIKSEDNSVLKGSAAGIASAVEGGLRFAGKIAKWVGKKIRGAAAAAVIAFTDPHVVIQKVQETVLTTLTASRSAKRGADDATLTAVNGARSAVVTDLKRRGVVSKEIWMSKHDQKVRDTHEDADGQVKSPSGHYVVGGHRCKYPRDPVLPPEESSECRCESVAVYNDSYAGGK